MARPVSVSVRKGGFKSSSRLLWVFSGGSGGGRGVESLSRPTMIGQKLMDEAADCGSFFDHIDDLLDFPVEDVEAGLPLANHDSFPSIWSAQTESLPCSDSVFTNNSSSADLSAELSVPYEDIVQLEWLSTFVEDSFSGESLTINKLESSMTESKEPTSHHQFHTSSPVSVLDSSSSCSGSGGKPSPWSPESATPKGSRCGRARSKRPRPATFSPRPAIQILLPGGALDSSAASPKASFESENAAESQPVKIKIPKPAKNPEHKKKKKIKPAAAPLGPTNGNQNPPSTQPVRKCLHCEITKTPQWRAGPMGPKTLCNACGVRYKSGRLFPEYRPAASPTFVPSVHSNSHKKVLEMRSKGEGEPGVTLIPNTNVAIDYSV
ncbi:hypothetical protein CRG98_023254 [Punica granatum]|uniref:GATA transcription factor n=1 Tax=Punica granatum TaxID=22663 RepID=A0A2I0JJC2_PUNGR|nr:hypothetical protein CRG98_023254 [Punica granatum]